MADVVAKYPCAMKDLYSVFETAFTNYSNKQTNFTNYKGLYTPAFKTAAMTAMLAAKALPDDEARSAVAETLRVQLVKLGDVVLQNFQWLKGYIESAFSEDVWAIQFKAAGGSHYAAAANEDWESLDSLGQDMKNYLALNNTLLLGVAPALNMPTGFPTNANGAYASFLTQYGLFKVARETAVATATKVNANNAIFKTLMGMLRDGQRIFMNDDESRDLFVFSTLLEMINPAKAGIKGKVKVVGTNAPIEEATVKAQIDGGVAIEIDTDVDGGFGLQLSEGKFVVTISADGYVTQSMEVSLTDGYKMLDVHLVPA